VFKTPLIAAVGAALALALSAAPASAQSTTVPNDSTTRTESDVASGTVRGETVVPGRIGGGRQEENRSRQARPGRPSRGPTPEENRIAAQAVATGLGNSCQVTEALLLGARPEGGNVYEAVCATGPGYIFSATTPPNAADCVDLAGAGAMAREKDPAAEVGLQCTLPANQNAVAVIGGYAREAGVTCQVDAGLAIAVNRYEVGCAGADGYWVERQENGWAKIPCWSLKIEGQTCRFSTEEESNAIWATALTGTNASGCAVQQVRQVGVDAQRLAVYELKCAAGDGWLARLDIAGQAKRVQACSDPLTAGVAGGCQLTTQATQETAPTE